MRGRRRGPALVLAPGSGLLSVAGGARIPGSPPGDPHRQYPHPRRIARHRPGVRPPVPEAGDRVIATARDDDGLARLQALGAQPLRLDVSEPASVSGLAWQLDGEKIDVALYVAGVYSTAGATVPPTREEFDQLMHTNVLGRDAGDPAGRAAGGRRPSGKFVFITSEMGHIAGAGVQLRLDLPRQQGRAQHGRGLRAARLSRRDVGRAQCPGWVQTDMGGAGAPADGGAQRARDAQDAGRPTPAPRAPSSTTTAALQSW